MDQRLAVQSDGKILVAGDFNGIGGVTRPGLARLDASGQVDETFQTGFGTGATIGAAFILPENKILVAGTFGTPALDDLHGLARLNPDGSADTTFKPDLGTNSASAHVHAAAVLPDGRFVVLISYPDTVQGAAGTSWQLIRLKADGSFDMASGPIDAVTGGPLLGSPFVQMLAVTSSGGVLLGGNGPWRLRDGVVRDLARFNANLQPDTSFAPTLSSFYPWAYPWAGTTAIASLENGKVLVGGGFWRVNGQPRRGLARLAADGTVEPGFSVGHGVESDFSGVTALAWQNDGKLLLGGSFTRVNGVTCNGTARLTRTGEVDSSFNIGVGPDGDLSALCVDADGHIWLGGAFTRVNRLFRPALVRLASDGTVDSTFDAHLAGDFGDFPQVNALLPAPDGSVFVGGDFRSIFGTRCNGLAKLRPDGSLDESFAPENEGPMSEVAVYALAMQADGRLLVGGSKQGYQPVLLRLNRDGQPDT